MQAPLFVSIILYLYFCCKIIIVLSQDSDYKHKLSVT